MRTILRILAALACIGCGSAQAAVSFGACQPATDGHLTRIGGPGPFTDNTFTISAGASQALVLFVLQGSAGGGIAVSATWNGVPFSTTGASAFNSGLQADILVLKNPAQGTQTLSISAAGTSFSTYMMCYFNGVDQTTVFQNATNNTVFANPISVTVTTASGNAVVAGFDTGGAFSSTNNTNVLLDTTNGNAVNYLLSTGTSATMTASGGSGLATGLDLIAATGGGGTACNGGLLLRGAGAC